MYHSSAFMLESSKILFIKIFILFIKIFIKIFIKMHIFGLHSWLSVSEFLGDVQYIYIF